MKAYIPKILLWIYLFSATELTQLLKMPLLFSHFTEHQAQNPAMSFGEFMYHHYAIEHENDGDGETDKKLPFKSHDTCCSFVFPISIFTTFQLEQVKTIFVAQANIITYSSVNIISAYLSTIWQPPRA